MSTFPYTCEECLDTVRLTNEEVEQRRGHDGWLRIRCDQCAGHVRKRRARIRKGYEHRRDTGCIVTWKHPTTAQLRVQHAPGLVKEALNEIVATLPQGAEIQTISTPGSVLGDLNGPRLRGGKRVQEATDVFSVERRLLSEIHRLDLLPARARRI